MSFEIKPSVFFICLIGAVTIGLLASCRHHPVMTGDDPIVIPVADCDPDSVYFVQDVLPLLIQSCGVIGCHDPGTAQDGVILTDYASIINTADVRPGRPDNSDLYEVITETRPDKRMPPPPRNPLTNAQIRTIEKWILQGAKNNSCEPDCDPGLGSYSEQVWPLIQKHCLSCHSGSDPQGGLSLATYTAIAEAGSNGSLLGAISWSGGYTPMPLNGNKLSDCEISQIEKWILNGRPND